MHFSIDRTVHTTAFDKPVVDHWLKRKIAQTAAGSTEKDRSDDRPLQRRTRYRLRVREEGLVVLLVREEGLVALLVREEGLVVLLVTEEGLVTLLVREEGLEALLVREEIIVALLVKEKRV